MPDAQEKIIYQNRSFRPRLPDFLKQIVPEGNLFHEVQNNIDSSRLNTVCEQAKCPNRTHCYARGTLTFQILGKICTRSCGFCSEQFGDPAGLWDETESARVVDAAKQLQLKHVVITSPARDDLPDDGAQAFATVVRKFREELPQVTVEILTPDFRAKPDALSLVFESRPDIFNHNIETVRRLTPKVRSKATYARTLFVLKEAAKAQLITKSGLMVGHGEEEAEIMETFGDLANAGCQMVTVGQYLPPSPRHLPLQKIYTPEEFKRLETEALKFGFIGVSVGPLVRSSYYAEELIKASMVHCP